MISSTNDTERNYNLTVCSDPRLVWFRNAKVCTRSTIATLRALEVTYEIENGSGVLFTPERWPDHLKFAFVRNPWDRLVSGWNNKIFASEKFLHKFGAAQLQEFQSFDTFVRFVCEQDLRRWDRHFALQTRNVRLDALDFLGRFENFSDDLRFVFSQVGIVLDVEIPHHNRSKTRKYYREYYTNETRDLVANAYRDDIEAFEYCFD